jgi:nicotinamide mononucleotide transporter
MVSTLYTRGVNTLEIIAVVTGIASVLFSIRRHVLTYPIGLISVLLYVWFCYHGGLYGDMMVNLFFAILSITGWYAWDANADTEHLVPISALAKRHRYSYLFASLVLILCIWFVLHYFTTSTVAFPDAFVTGLSVIGMILMNQRKIEHWWCWIIVDACSIPLFWSKGLPLTSLQFGLLHCFAWWGFFSWRQQLSALDNDVLKEGFNKPA